MPSETTDFVSSLCARDIIIWVPRSVGKIFRSLAAPCSGVFPASLHPFGNASILVSLAEAFLHTDDGSYLVMAEAEEGRG